MTLNQIDANAMAILAITGFVGTFLPFILWIICWRKRHASLIHFLITGAFVFMMAGFIQPIVLTLLDRAMHITDAGTSVVSVLIGSVFAVIFECGTLLLVYRFFLRDHETLEAAWSTSLGYAAVYSMMMGSASLADVSTLRALYMNGIEATTSSANFTEEELANFIGHYNEMAEYPISIYIQQLIGVLLLMAVQICVGILVYIAYHNKKAKLFFIAVLGRVLYDVIVGIIPNAWVSIAILCVMLCGLFYLARKEFYACGIPYGIREENSKKGILGKAPQGQKSLKDVMNQSSIVNKEDGKPEKKQELD